MSCYLHVQVKAVDQNASIIYRRSDIFDLSDGPRLAAACITRSVAISEARRPPQITPRMGSAFEKGAECELKVVIDHTFYQDIAGSNPNMSVSLVTQHIAVADFVFRTTDLMNLDSLPDNVGFSIIDIEIYESEGADDYKISDTSMKHDRIMNEFSSYDFDGFCLAVAFTKRELGQLLQCFSTRVPWNLRLLPMASKGSPNQIEKRELNDIFGH